MVSTKSRSCDMTAGLRSAAAVPLWALAAWGSNLGKTRLSATSSKTQSPFSSTLDGSDRNSALAFLSRCATMGFKRRARMSVCQSTKRLVLRFWLSIRLVICGRDIPDCPYPLLSPSSPLLDRSELSGSVPLVDDPELAGPILRFTQYVWICPFPLMLTSSSRGRIQASLPASTSRSAVVWEIWMFSFLPVLSMRLAVLTVSPNNWNWLFSPRKTPAVTGPL
mmetsp:Transcript_8524/g.24548  ORF Transcript_8524/g.24548 Transcript_8524/m.24548 type:complete len:222 (-) Transcript_8524:873-1538(-)